MITRELLQLNTELTAFLGEDLPIAIKYRLHSFTKEVDKRFKLVMDVRNQIINRIEPSGSIPNLIDDKPNPKLLEFNKEYETVLKEEVTGLEFPKIELHELSDLKSKNYYPMLFEHLIKG